MRQQRLNISTNQLTHPPLIALKEDRFKAFARFELEHRKPLFYPPWAHIMRIIAALTPETALKSIEKVAYIADEQIRRNIDKLEKKPHISLLGPAPAPMERINSRYRFHLLVKSTSPKFNSILAREIRS